MHYQQQNSMLSKHNEVIYYRNCLFDAHMHRDYELILLLKGSLEITAGGKSRVMEAPLCALMLKDQVHAIRSLHNTSAIIHVFSGDIVPAFNQAVSRKMSSTCIFTLPADTLRFYVNTMVQTRDYSDFSLKGLLYIVLSHYLAQTEFTSDQNRQETIISTVFSYISRHYTEKITLEDVAAVCGYNAHYVSRVFASSIGINFKKVVNGYRLAHAMELIQETDLSMTEIALASGFGSVRSFNRVYAESLKDRNGVSSAADSTGKNPVRTDKLIENWDSLICLHESSSAGVTLTCRDEAKLDLIRQDLHEYL